MHNREDGGPGGHDLLPLPSVVVGASRSRRLFAREVGAAMDEIIDGEKVILDAMGKKMRGYEWPGALLEKHVIIKLMGRYSGFIAMYATLASRDVDCCLTPESPFYMDGEGGLLQYVERRLNENKHMVIVVAEGAGQDIIAKSIPASDQQDASGNKLLLDIGLWLTHKIKDHFKSKKMEMTIKYIDPTYMIRAIPSNATDNVYCTLLAHSAIHGAMAGYSFTIVMVNGRHAYIPFYRVTSTRNKVKITDRMWARLLSPTNQPSFLSQKDIDEAREANRLANKPPLPSVANHNVTKAFDQSASTSSNGEI
ncbi:ATP-dependent 6-phosphofructokinase 7-like [Triticum aestivum]|uniref:ATP-dependent 6-phosphofructokinase 7-like n=1 Tax=Triticum aestivum TaxID=4565 RepID=UPI001D0300FF|nr:ATP-dependent 6-phosphofructokinase 7-like [Triticum aestivum]